MQTTIMSYIWRHSKSQPLTAVMLTLVSFPKLYLSLELPKIIVNEAISHVRDSRTLLGVEFGPNAVLSQAFLFELADKVLEASQQDTVG